jgi:ribosomal protein L34E
VRASPGKAAALSEHASRHLHKRVAADTLCATRQLRSIDRLLEKLRASVEQADRPFGSSVHTKNLRDKISELLRERQEICFEQRPH